MITEQAVLASIHLRKPAASKIDKNITSRVLHDSGASGGGGIWSTKLFPNGALEPISTLDAQIRAYYISKTLAWADDGIRLLPQAKFLEYSEQISNFSDVRVGLVKTFVENYDATVAEIQTLNNGLFRAEAYPPKAVVAAKFTMSSDISPIPTTDDFRVTASADEVKEMKESLNSQIARATEAAEMNLAERVAEPLAKMMAKLTEKPKDGKKLIFRDTLLTNIHDIVKEIPAYNIGDNPAFAELHKQMTAKGAIANLPPSVVRESPELQEIAVKQAGMFLDQLNEVFG